MNHRFLAVAVVALLAAAPLAPLPAGAVNLVPNGDFETYVSCPTGYGQLNVATPWDAPTTGTSDYLNACAPVVFPSLNVPQNQLGFQAAYSGVGYAGLIPLSASADYREYLQAPFSAPLVASASYLVTFRVSLADSALLALDRLGAYLSVGPVGPVPNYAPLALTPQVESPPNAFLTNSTGWTLVSGVYVAAGGEDHIVIGNFHDDASTATVAGPGLWPGGSYYYVDDVSVELQAPVDQACCTSDGLCTIALPGECVAMGGTPLGPGTNCDGPNCGAVRARPGTWGALKGIYR